MMVLWISRLEHLQGPVFASWISGQELHDHVLASQTSRLGSHDSIVASRKCFADLKFRKSQFFFLQYSLKCFHPNLKGTVLGYCNMAFRSLKYTNLGKKRIMLKANQCGLDQKPCYFPCKFADLWFADWYTKEICELAFCGLIITNLRIADFLFADWHTSEICDFRKRNEPKKLRIYNLRTRKKNLHDHYLMNVERYENITELFWL